MVFSAPVSLADVMSEELADQLQKKEYKHLDKTEVPPDPPETGAQAGAMFGDQT